MSNMPESCRGRDGEEERRDQGNIVSTISQFVDENLTFVRVGSVLSSSLHLLRRVSVDPDIPSCPQFALWCLAEWRLSNLSTWTSSSLPVCVSLTEHQHSAGSRWSCCDSEKSQTGERDAVVCNTCYSNIKILFKVNVHSNGFKRTTLVRKDQILCCQSCRFMRQRHHYYS